MPKITFRFVVFFPLNVYESAPVLEQELFRSKKCSVLCGQRTDQRQTISVVENAASPWGLLSLGLESHNSHKCSLNPEKLENSPEDLRYLCYYVRRVRGA